MQVHCALRSLFLHCLDLERLEIFVLYRATTAVYERQYRTVAAEFGDSAQFVAETAFRRQMLWCLSPFAHSGRLRYSIAMSLGRPGMRPGSLGDRLWRRTVGAIQRHLARRILHSVPASAHILFAVDDAIFVQDFRVAEAVAALASEPRLLGISLRLGENTTYSYTEERPQCLPAFKGVCGPFLAYEWSGADLHFGYPLEVSSSIYRSSDILPYLCGLPFRNPSQLEERMAFHAPTFRRKRPLLACYRQGVAFTNHVNLVQSEVPNRAGVAVHHSASELAERFDRGERIHAESYSNMVVNACNQEVPLVFHVPGRREAGLRPGPAVPSSERGLA